MQKKILIIFGIFLLCFGMYFVSKDDSNDSSESDTYSIAEAESSKISDDKLREYTNINIDSYFDLYNSDETSIIAFIKDGCQYCEIANKIIKNIMYENDFDLNSVVTNTLTEEEQEKLINSNSYFSSFGTPSIVVVSEGDIIDSIDGLNTTKEYENFFKKYGLIK